MKRWKLLPGLAVKGVTQNGRIYYPYIIACIFSVFTYFIFASILENDLIATLPHSTYAWLMLMIGKVLLVLILVPFIDYAQSFLIKRRKKETGLYLILGMERKHLICLLLLETVLIYVAAVSGGIFLGCILAKLFFLMLLRLSSLPVEVEFVFTWKAFAETILFFAAVSLWNFLHGSVSIVRARPVELFSGSRRGEKEPRFALPGTLCGVVVMLLAYKTVFEAKLDSTIFFCFFLSVFLAVVGTYLLFTFAGVVVLKFLRTRKRFYYRPENFITISGMYYRMKKSAAGLANICIFSTMVIITLTCTVALYAGLDGIRHFDYAYEAVLTYEEDGMSRAEAETLLAGLSEKQGIFAERLDSWGDFCLDCGRSASSLKEEQPDFKTCQLHLITLEEYNRLTGRTESLKDGQAILYSTGAPYGYDFMDCLGIPLEILETSDPLFPWPKAGREYFGESYVLAVKDEEVVQNVKRAWEIRTGKKALDGNVCTGIVLQGPEEAKEQFMEELKVWQNSQNGYFVMLEDGVEGGQVIYSMNGGLLFIGILFGMIFFMCLLLIMYYKQLSEGYEDQGSFVIMQKVGMGEEDIRSTVRRQMLSVFAIPMLMALLHSAVGMCMVNQLMGMLRMFDTALLIRCSIGVAFGFAVVYMICYGLTSKAYYRIVLRDRG